MNRLKQAQKYFCDTDSFHLECDEYRRLIEFFLFEEIERDSGLGDVTTDLCLSNIALEKTAQIVAKSSGIIAGAWEVEYFLKTLGLKTEWRIQDGELVEKGMIILTITGDAAMLLKAERAMLNFLGRLSGIATASYQLVQKAENKALIVPTRKTLWGLLDKRACTAGGAGTHRLHASSAVLIKENHWALLKNRDISSILNSLDNKVLGKFLEIEVENEQEAFDSMKVLSVIQNKGVQGVLMFDNFSPEEITRLLPRLKEIHPDILFEASGGLTFDNMDTYVSTGVDILSFGFLTHSAPHFDLSLRLQ